MESEPTIARGVIKKLVSLVVGGAALIAVGTWYGPFAQGYEVKNSAKLACNDLIRQFRFKVEGQEDAWREPFLRRALVGGVTLKPSQYSFKVTHERNQGEYVCKVKIKYPTESEVWLIGDVLELKPVKFSKDFSFEHKVRDSF